MYVFVRNDLSAPQQAVQACHASIECANLFNLEKLPDHPSVIILAAKNENKLQQCVSFLSENNIQFVEFHEPDLGHQLTAIATEPIFGDKRNLFKKFQLLRSKGGVQ